MNLWENKFQDALHPNNSWGPSRIKEKTEWQIHCEDFDIYYWLPKCIRYEKSWVFTKGFERKAEFWPILKYLSCTCLVCKYAHLTLLKLNSKTKLLMADVLVKKVYWLRPQRTRKEIMEETDDDNDIFYSFSFFSQEKIEKTSINVNRWTGTGEPKMIVKQVGIELHQKILFLSSCLNIPLLRMG